MALLAMMAISYVFVCMTGTKKKKKKKLLNFATVRNVIDVQFTSRAFFHPHPRVSRGLRCSLIVAIMLQHNYYKTPTVFPAPFTMLNFLSLQNRIYEE